MKLNKISNALRLIDLKWQPKSAIYCSALVLLLSTNVYAQEETETRLQNEHINTTKQLENDSNAATVPANGNH